jgi:DNA invertase Pin-like site-specific DNA recombinase
MYSKRNTDYRCISNAECALVFTDKGSGAKDDRPELG